MSPDAVVYVTSRWGEPSQTFVRREAEAVASHEVRVAAASIKEPVPGGNVSSVLHLRPLQVVVGFARSFTRHPGRVLGLVKQIVVLSSPRNIAPQVAAAVIGCAWVGSRRLGRGHLHAHFGWVAATAAWAAAALDDRTFSVALHAFEIHDRRYLDRFTPVPLAAASAVFTESHKDRAIVAERFGVVAEVARLGVPGAWLDPHDDAERSDDLIVSVGRLVEKKGYPVLLRALAITDFPWRLRIVGEGPERQALEALIEELGLGDRVVLSGAATEGEVQAALRSAAVACLASVETPSGDRDGTPMALVESMASGAAVVASDTGSIAELLDDGGVVVPAGDADALAAALDALADRDRRLELGRRGRARVASEWTSDRTAETVLGVLRARRRPRGVTFVGTVLRRVVGGRTPALLVARVVEQGTLGVASLLLARRLGVDDYAPIAVILIVNSFAVSLSDFGLGTAILSGPVRSVRPGLLRHARLTNVAILAVAAALSTVLTGDARGLVIGSAVVWALSAEAFVRKACLIRLGATLRTAVLEVIGSSLVAISVAFAWFSPGDALAWTVAGLAAKHLSESVFAFRWRRALGSEGDPRQVISVWFTQVLAYACANVDFVIVGAVVSSAAFSVYSLGFRASAVISSQVGYAVLRVMLVDFSEATTADDRQRVLDRRFRQLFSLGAASAIVSAAAALFLPFILGGQWRAIVGVVVVLAVGVPWRMTLSVVGSLALDAGESRRLVTWEVGRLAATVVLLAGAALVSFPAFVVASSVVAILATCVEQHLVARLTGLRTWRHLNLLSGLGVAVALASGVLVSTPH